MLAIIAGLFLIGQGLFSAGVMSRVSLVRFIQRPMGSGGPTVRGTLGSAIIPSCLAGGMLGPLLRSGGSQAAFLAGMLTGFLPCGLVYAYLALAASTHNPLAGLLTMVAFGLGTVPLMVLTGAGMSLVNPARRQFVLRLAAWCVVITGVIALARGVYAFETEPSKPEPSCPFCP
jgi:sulfite exporter TauE/SafE